jgi:hypothetical protein
MVDASADFMAPSFSRTVSSESKPNMLIVDCTPFCESAVDSGAFSAQHVDGAPAQSQFFSIGEGVVRTTPSD